MPAVLLAWAGLCTQVSAGTPIQHVRISPDVAVDLDGTPVSDEQFVDDLGAPLSVLGLGVLPTAVDVDAYHRLLNGDQLFSTDTTIQLPGGLVARPADVVRYDGQGYSLEFDASAAGLGPGVDCDAVATDFVLSNGQLLDGQLLLSFDVTLALGAITVADSDLVRYDGVDFTLFFDGTAAGIPAGLDVDAADYLFNGGNFLLSFDSGGQVGSVPFTAGDILEYDAATGWSMAYDVSSHQTGWGGANLDALHAEPRCPTAWFGQTLLAESESQFAWASPVAWQAVRGDLAGLGGYLFDTQFANSGTVLTDSTVPVNGSGFWYLVKPDCALPLGSWQAQLGATPGRDAVLP